MADVEEPNSDISTRLQTMSINPHCNLSRVASTNIDQDAATYSSVIPGLQLASNGSRYPLMNAYDGCHYTSQYPTSNAPHYDRYSANNPSYHGHVYKYGCSSVGASAQNSCQSHDNNTNNVMYWPHIYGYSQNEYYQGSCGSDQAFLNQPQSASPSSTQVGHPQTHNFVGGANPLVSLRSSASTHQHSVPTNQTLGHTSLKGIKFCTSSLGMNELPLDVQGHQRTVCQSNSRVDSSMITRPSINASKVVELKLKANLDARRQKHANSSYTGLTKEREVTVNRHVLYGSNHDFNDVKNNHVKRQSQTSSFLESSFTDAKFFIIKSYSEDNVYKSIKFNVWASTACGNKKLNEAFEEAQVRAKDKPQGCPIFLFFSVNGSRQFCGIAEMVGSVDYSKSMPFWEQHKWNGSFPVKWHVVKDLPNSQLRHIILENNECKPVTNSRDGQEVQFQLGLEMLSIFRNYPTRSSIMDEYWLQLSSLEKDATVVEQAKTSSSHNFSKMPEADITHKDKQSGSRPVNEPSKWRRIGKLIDVSDDVDGKALDVTI